MTKITIYTVCVDNYLPDLCKITLSSIARYAIKINADFHIISERKYPKFPPTYEKVQIHDLGKDNTWNILIDADMVIGKDMPNLTTLIPPNYVSSYMSYQADLLFEADQYFLRDGRRIGICSNFMIAHKMCHDIWTPLDMGYEEALSKTKRKHIIDEYCFSRNLARYGLKLTGFDDKDPPSHFLHLDASINNEEEMILKAKNFLGMEK